MGEVQLTAPLRTKTRIRKMRTNQNAFVRCEHVSISCERMLMLRTHMPIELFATAPLSPRPRERKRAAVRCEQQTRLDRLRTKAQAANKFASPHATAPLPAQNACRNAANQKCARTWPYITAIHHTSWRARFQHRARRSIPGSPLGIQARSGAPLNARLNTGRYTIFHGRPGFNTGHAARYRAIHNLSW